MTIYDEHPDIFAGLDPRTQVDIAMESLELAGGGHPTRDDLEHAREHITGGLPEDDDGTVLCPQCGFRLTLAVAP